MSAVIVAAGSMPPDEAARRILSEATEIICADGGLDALKRLGFRPDVLVGDFDSVSGGEPSPAEGYPIYRFPVRKDETDFELVLEYAFTRGIREAVALGATGTRLDHSMCNLMLLAAYARKGLNCELVDATNRIRYLLPGTHRVAPANAGEYDSFLAVPEDCVITLRGFDYEVESVPLRFGSSLGISNHAVSPDACIEIDGPGVFYLRSRDR